MLRTFKVLNMFSGKEVGGIARVVLPLLTSLNGNRCVVTTLFLSDGPMLEMARDLGLRTHLLQRRSSIDISLIKKISAFISKEGFDIIHTHSIVSNFYGRSSILNKNVKLVTTVHADVSSEIQDATGSWIKSKIWYLVDTFMARYSTLLIANSEATRKNIKERGVKDEKISVIHNGIVCNDMSGVVSSEIIRKKYDIPLTSPLIGTAGRLTKSKNQVLLIHAAPAVLQEFPDAYFLIVGDGNLKEDFVGEAAKLGISSKVIFTGWQEDIYSFIMAMDVFVMPSQKEGFGIAVLESMACSKPVVATDVGGLGEIVVDGETGFMVPEGDNRMLAEKIVTILKDSALLCKMGERGRSHLEEKFSVETMAEETQALYGKVLEEC